MENNRDTPRERLLDPLDRICEILFGLIMAVTIVGSLSIATAGRNEIRTMMAAALGCNLAWGLVDAVMYLVRTFAERARNRALARRVIGADTAVAHRLIAGALPPHMLALTSPDEIESMRRRLLALSVPVRATLERDDLLGASAIFLWVVVATFPVVVPFLFIDDVTKAMRASQAISLAMLLVAGIALGRYAGYAHPLRTGLWMMLLGAALIAAVNALGG